MNVVATLKYLCVWFCLAWFIENKFRFGGVEVQVHERLIAGAFCWLFDWLRSLENQQKDSLKLSLIKPWLHF